MNYQATYTSPANTKAGLILTAGSRATRQPVHMILLCDTSGSMEENNKLQSVKRSVSLLLSLLGSNDRLSLITFGDTSTIVLSRSIPSPTDRQSIQYKIDNLEPDGSTNLSAGLLDVRSLVETADSGRKQGLIVLTDGHANIGVVKEEGLVEIVSRIQSESPGLTLTCVGYGVSHNSELLTSLAKTGGGSYNVVKDLEDVATVFGDILGGLVSVSAQGVQVVLPPGVEIDPNTAYRYEVDSSGKTTIYIGDIYAESETTILFQTKEKQPIQVCVKGTDMITLNTMNEMVEVSQYSREDPNLKTIRITELRQRTATLLKEAAKNTGPEMVARIDALINEIQTDDAIENHSLKPMLLEDLEEAKKIASKKVPFDLHRTTAMFQHSAYLGMSRGMRSNTRPAEAVTAVMQASPFSTRAQAQYASAMRTASQKPDDADIYS